jgi:hypothetical protein
MNMIHVGEHVGCRYDPGWAVEVANVTCRAVIEKADRGRNATRDG